MALNKKLYVQIYSHLESKIFYARQRQEHCDDASVLQDFIHSRFSSEMAYQFQEWGKTQFGAELHYDTAVRIHRREHAHVSFGYNLRLRSRTACRTYGMHLEDLNLECPAQRRVKQIFDEKCVYVEDLLALKYFMDNGFHGPATSGTLINGQYPWFVKALNRTGYDSPTFYPPRGKRIEPPEYLVPVCMRFSMGLHDYLKETK